MAEVDLHLHTTRSDGGLTPTQLVELLAKNGVKIAAITDHDSTNGLDEAFAAAEAHPELTIIAGTEISADVKDGEVHVLTYFVDKDDPDFQGTLERFREGRLARGEGMVSKLAGLGMPLAWERVLELAGDASVGRPHVAQALLEKGYVQSRQEAFTKYIGRDGPAYVEREKLTPEEAVEMAVKNGALPVLAHPTWVNNVEEWLPKLKEAGLVGMEVFYGKYTPDEVTTLLNLTERFDLVPCGGSDYHATGADGEALPGQVGPPMSSFERLRALKAGRG